jgi:hypothetical protein
MKMNRKKKNEIYIYIFKKKIKYRKNFIIKNSYNNLKKKKTKQNKTK